MRHHQGQSGVRRDSGEASVQLRGALHRLEQRQRQDDLKGAVRGHHVVAVEDQKGIWNPDQEKKVRCIEICLKVHSRSPKRLFVDYQHFRVMMCWHTCKKICGWVKSCQAIDDNRDLVLRK